MAGLYPCFPAACSHAGLALPASREGPSGVLIALALQWLLPSCFPWQRAAHLATFDVRMPSRAGLTLCGASAFLWPRPRPSQGFWPDDLPQQGLKFGAPAPLHPSRGPTEAWRSKGGL